MSDQVSKLQQNLNKTFFGANSSKTIVNAIVLFAFFYHFCFMLFFKKIGVEAMFIFNIFSVSIFGSMFFIFLIRNVNDFTIAYFLSYVEVVFHQLLAEYYIGASCAFHYFIFLMGFIAFLMLKNHFKIATAFGAFSSFLFVALELASKRYIPVVALDDDIIAIIRTVNISLGIFIIFIVLLIFVAMALEYEQSLENQVSEKSKEVNLQVSKVNTLQNHLIVSLASLVENRDSDTGEHIQRTSAYVELIAKKAFEKNVYPDVITKEFISVLKRAAPMHDVGKIVVPDYILKKPGKLTSEEFEQIKRHTTEGGRIINEVVGVSEDKFYLKVAEEVALCHHERWDGNGYPCRFKAEDIPVSARIMAIADVFDALVSPRCYKEPFPREVAYKIIEEEKGTHFDPILADLFLESKDKIDKILKKYTK